MADGPVAEVAETRPSGDEAARYGRATKASEKVGHVMRRFSGRSGKSGFQQDSFKAPAFRRNFFVTEEGVHREGTSNPHKEGWRKFEKKAAPHEWVQFSDESRHALSSFLKDHVMNIHRLAQNQPDALPEEDRELLKMLGGDLSASLDQDALEININKGLEDPRMWEMGMERYRYVQMYKRLALGARTVTLLDESLDDSIGKGVDLTKDQVRREGTVHKFGRERLMPNLEDIKDYIIKPGGVVAGAAGTYAAILRATGSHATAASLAALWPAAGIAISAADSGKKLRDKLEPYAEAFKVLMKDPKLATYVQHITGERVDPHDYKIVAGKVVLDLLKPVHNSLNVPSLIREVKAGQETLNRFYRELGIKDYHASPEEFLFRLAEGKSTHREPVPTRLAKRIKDIMETDPKFEITTRADLADNIAKYMGARTKAMMEMITEYAEDSLKNAVDPRSETIDGKISAREKDGRVAKKKTEDETKKKTIVENYKGKLPGAKEALTDYRSALEPLGTDREALRSILAGSLRGIYATPEDAIKALEELVNNPTSTASVTIDGRPQRPIAKALAENDQWLRDRYNEIDLGTGAWAQRAGEKDKAYTDRLATGYTSKATEHKRREDRIVKEQEAVDALIAKIREAQKKISISKDTLSDSNAAVVKMTETVERMDKSYEEVIGWKITGLDQNALRTMSPDELLDIINKANKRKKSVGWREDDNEANQQKLMEAIIEAQSRYQESLDPKVHERKVNGYVRITGKGIDQYGISDHFLATSSLQEVRDRVNEIKKARPTLFVLVDSSLNNAIVEAKNRLTVRAEAFDEVGKSWDKKITELEARINKASEALKPEADQLRTVQTLLARKRSAISDKTFELAVEMQSGSDLGNRHLDTAKISGTTEGYTAAEQKVKAEVGYYELLNFLFDYRGGFDYKTNDSDGNEVDVHETREEYFNRIHKALPPEKLAELVLRGMEPGTPAGTTIDMNRLLMEIRGGLQTQTTTFRDLRRGFSVMIDKLYQETELLD